MLVNRRRCQVRAHVETDTAADELVGRATNLRPLLAANAAQGEVERQVPQQSIEAMAEAGVFKVMVPKRYSGYEATMAVQLDVSAAVAAGDGGAGWIVSLIGACAWGTSLFSGQAQDDVFGADPDARVCGSIPPTGSSVRVDGGWRISGRWSYTSGSPHAQWALLGALLVQGDDRPPMPGIALIPMSELEFVDTWHMAGMRASGSHTLVADDVFVPEHRTLSTILAAQGQYATEYQDETLYHAAFFPVLTLTLVGPLLGLGTAALDHVRTAAATKGIAATTFARQADSTGFQLQFAEAAMRIDSARLHAHRAADDIDRHASERSQPDAMLRARVRADASYAAQQVLAAIDILCNAHGSGGFAESSPLRRIWQDANVGARHGLITPAVSYEVYGKALLGVENTVSIAV
jgi:alkylation response protein AidB-like acyl-CoA dehydrogenase